VFEKDDFEETYNCKAFGNSFFIYGVGTESAMLRHQPALLWGLAITHGRYIISSLTVQVPCLRFSCDSKSWLPAQTPPLWPSSAV